MNRARKLKRTKPAEWNIDDMPVMKALEFGYTYEYPPRAVMVHGAMWYQCEDCGSTWRMWLEDGLEDRRDPKNHKPVPFCIKCKCGGTAQHVMWNEDIRMFGSRPLGDKMNYFRNEESSDCGVPVLQ